MLKSLQDKQNVVLFFHLALLLFFHQQGFTGHYGYDDMEYASLANQLLEGNLDLEHHFAYRSTLIFATALSYLIFGISDFSSTLPGLLAAALILILIFKVLKPYGSIYCFIGLSFGLLSPWFLQYSNKLMPDIFLAAAVFSAVYAYAKYAYIQERKMKWKYAFLFSIALFLGFCSKGTIILILPWLAYLFCIDFFIHKDRKFWLNTILIGIGLTGIYFLIVYQLTGSSFKRFEAITSNAYLNKCSYDQQSIHILLRRLGKGLSGVFMREGFFSAGLFLIPAFFQENWKKRLCLENQSSYFVLTGILLLLSANFMSISLEHYVPMCLDARHYLYILPVFAIVATNYFREFEANILHRILILGFALLMIVYAISDDTRMLFQTYIPLFIILLIFQFEPFRKKKILVALLLFCTLSIRPYDIITYANHVNYSLQREIIKKKFVRPQTPTYAIGNEVFTRLGSYYQGFDKSHPVKLLSYDKFSFDTLQNKEILLVNNQHFNGLMFYQEKDLPFYIRYPSKDDQTIYLNEQLGIHISKTEEVVNPETHGKEIIYSKIGFEENEKINNWNFSPDQIRTQPSFGGRRSYLCPEYSVTYTQLLDSNELEFNQIFLDAKLKVWVADQSKASLVISLEKEGEMVHYRKVEIQNYLVAFSSWSTIDLSTLVETKLIPMGTNLKIYLWNPGLDDIYIDNFEVELIGMP